MPMTQRITYDDEPFAPGTVEYFEADAAVDMGQFTK